MTSTHPLPPLHGLRVVDLSWLLPGPYCTSLLADLGAEVLKIERPGDGDYTRDMLPGLFHLVNRGKKSAVFDLRRDDDRARLLDLVASVDVFVEGFRPGVVDRLGVNYDAVKARNPGIVYAAISGYGQSGPDATKPAHDINFCAAAGLLSIPASVTDTSPRRMQLPISDIAGSMHAALAIVAALRQRDATGEGCYLDVAMADCALAWSAIRWMDAPVGRSGWRHIHPGNDIFATSDGDHVAFALVEPHFWTTFCTAAATRLGAEALGTLASAPPPRHDDAREDLLDRHRALAALIATQPAAFWVELGEEHDLPVTRVATSFTDAIASPHVAGRARDLLVDGEDGRAMPVFPVRMQGLPRHRTVPALGSSLSGGSA